MPVKDIARELRVDVPSEWALPETGAVGPTDSLAELIHAHLRDQHRAIVQGDSELRHGGDQVHPIRVATRRFRSVLRVLNDRFDVDHAQRLDAELRWYAGRLGAVRDLQVMSAHLLDAVQTLPDDVRPATGRYVAARLEADERAARLELHDVLDSPRYAALLTDLRGFLAEPVKGRRTAANNIRRYVRAARHTAAKRLDAAARPPLRDEQIHRARKAAKRGRYIAELAVPALGAKANRRVKAYKRVQDGLGELQDAVVAAVYLQRIAGTAPEDAGFGLGVLWCAERDRAERARRAARTMGSTLIR